MRTMTFDLFYSWRYLLVVVCTIYWIVRLGQSLWGWYAYLWAGGRSTELTRRYLFVHFLRMRVHRFTLELAQIVVLSVLFAVVTWAHRYV